MHEVVTSVAPALRPVRVLVVCHANVARSVAAVHLLAGSRDERGVAIELASAGTHASEGQPVSARTLLALRAALGHDVDLAGHRSHLLSADDVAWADVVVTMEASQVRFIRRTHPEADARTATLYVLAHTLPDDGRPVADRVAALHLAEVAPDAGGDVEDPAGGGDADYDHAMATLVEWCGELGRRLGA